ncbi:MAG: SpoIIE family protein phosphatase [Spirochaetaceae bacterium]|nr:SpoIIE family protein phosphatase [Spirochaetaceae bacterium]
MSDPPEHDDRSDGGFGPHAENGLESSDSALLETLLLEAPVAFAFYDTDLRYRRINRLLADVNGLPMADHIGRRPSEVLPEGLGEAVETRLREVLTTGRVVADDSITAPSPRTGEMRSYESKWFPGRDANGEVIGVAVLVSDVTEHRENEDALRRAVERLARLHVATSALAGALTVEDVRRVVAETAGSATGAELTEVCAIALERARLYERERSTAVALQQSLLPHRLPTVAGVELAARFRPGSAEADVGGDWYDVFELPDGRVVLVVGDVMGKGVHAAAGMGRLRSALRALAHANPLPEAVLQGLDRLFSATEGPDQIATLVYLVVDPVARRAAVSGAGHLPLVLCRLGRDPELIDAGSGSTPLGWSEPRTQRTLELGPGDILLGLTDGLVERRGHDLDEGLAEVLAAVRQPAGNLDELVERVSRLLMADTRGRDDATVLAVRFTA